jgi:hypothetical protein
MLDPYYTYKIGGTLRICGTIGLYFNLSRIRFFSSANYQALGTWQKLFEDSFGKQMKVFRRSAYILYYTFKMFKTYLSVSSIFHVFFFSIYLHLLYNRHKTISEEHMLLFCLDLKLYTPLWSARESLY